MAILWKPLDPYTFLWKSRGNLWIHIDSYGICKEISGFLCNPTEIIRKSTDSDGFLRKSWGNHWISVESYGNPKEIVGFLWIPMEIVKETNGFSRIPVEFLGKPLDPYGFLCKSSLRLGSEPKVRENTK